MNELIENHGRFSAEEFLRLVNEKLTKLDPNVEPFLLVDAVFCHIEQGLGVDTAVEEHLHYWHNHG